MRKVREQNTGKYYDPEKIARIIDCACEVSGLPKSLLLSGSRVNGNVIYHEGKRYENAYIADFKHIVIHLCLKHTDISLPKLASHLNMRNHTSMIWVRRKMQNALDRVVLTGDIDRIVNDLNRVERLFINGFDTCPIIKEAERLVGMHKRRLVA